MLLFTVLRKMELIKMVYRKKIDPFGCGLFIGAFIVFFSLLFVLFESWIFGLVASLILTLWACRPVKNGDRWIWH
jgi:hypothetical protein